MILKSYIIEQNINSLDKYKAILFYGENIGLKDDLKNNLKFKYKSYEIINLFQDDLLVKKDLLLEKTNNSSLFNSNKIIFLHEASDKIFKEIEECLDKHLEGSKLFVISNLLDKKSKIRNLFEKGDGLAALPCYKDNERTLFNNIKEKLKKYKGTTPELINMIIKNSNSDRRIINNELTKIKSFFLKKELNKKDLEILLNIKTNDDFSLIRDTALIGNKSKLNELIGEVDFPQEDIFFFLNQTSLRISKLIELKHIYETTNDYDVAIESLKPKIFWKDKPIFLQQLKSLKLNDLKDILSEIGDLELKMKKNNLIRNDVLLKKLIINICNQVSVS